MKKRIFIGILIGGILGFLYYRFVGCISGTCAITSNPIASTIYGAVLFPLILELMNDTRKSISKRLNKKKYSENG